ncbi:MAG TPA: ATP-binding protein, partial [Puia sp.]|nr:ATP-binding protein [Puia sp.]
EKISRVDLIPQDFGRVLLNLYNNAFYSVTEKKKTAGNEYEPIVSVTTKLISSPQGGTKSSKVEIRIRDNGLGVPLRIQDKIFQPFFTSKPTGQGTGLGLSLSYDIITKEHDGTLKLNSQEGEYAEFIISLPLKENT